MSFFSVDLEKLKKIDCPNQVLTKSVVSRILSSTPDTYYWYGNPNNWSYCYEIKLDEKKEIAIRKRQLFVLEDENTVYEYMSEGKEVPSNIQEIFLLYKSDINVTDVDPQPDFFPIRTSHIAPVNIYDLSEENFTDNAIKIRGEYNLKVDNSIDKLIKDYKANVSKKTGYNIEIQKVWLQYKVSQFSCTEIKVYPKYITHKEIKDEENKELEIKFLADYKEKI